MYYLGTLLGRLLVHTHCYFRNILTCFLRYFNYIHTYRIGNTYRYILPSRQYLTYSYHLVPHFSVRLSIKHRCILKYELNHHDQLGRWQYLMGMYIPTYMSDDHDDHSYVVRDLITATCSCPLGKKGSR